MGLLSELIANIENTRGQIKRRGLLDIPAIMGENIAQRVGPGLTATEHARSVVPEVRDAGREKSTESVLGLLGAIKAYHGSPHKFDKFDMSKIGTGEGAQAYGHGLYFAENPETAKAYANILGKFELKTPGKTIARDSALNDAESDALSYVSMAHTNGEKNPVGAALGYVTKYGGNEKKDTLAVLQKWASEGASAGKNASVYETSLRWPDAAREASDPLGPQHFLDFHKDLKDQPAILAKIPPNRLPKDYGADSSPAWMYDNLGTGTDAVSASEELRKLGIPGIRYLDAGSRTATPQFRVTFHDGTEQVASSKSAAESMARAAESNGYPRPKIAEAGTANYVLFDDALVEILKRNGIAP